MLNWIFSWDFDFITENYLAKLTPPQKNKMRSGPHAILPPVRDTLWFQSFEAITVDAVVAQHWHGVSMETLSGPEHEALGMRRFGVADEKSHGEGPPGSSARVLWEGAI